FEEGSDALADWILIRPIFLRERLVDDDNRKRILRVGFRKKSSSQQRNAHHREIIGADHMRVAVRAWLAGRHLQPLNCERCVPRIVADRQVVADRRARDAGQASDSLDDLLEERSDLWLLGILRTRQRELHRQGTVGIETRADLLKSQETSDQQPGAY